MKKLYIVYYSTGRWEDYCEIIVCITSDKQKAEDIKKDIDNKYEIANKLYLENISNSYYSDENEESFEDYTKFNDIEYFNQVFIKEIEQETILFECPF